MTKRKTEISSLNIAIGTKEVPDPFEPGAVLVVPCNTRESPLEHMVARGRIDGAQQAAGEKYRRVYEAAQIGPLRAMDPLKEAVDGGGAGNPLTDAMMQAAKELDAVHRAVGAASARLLMAIVGEGATIASVASSYRPLEGRSATGFVTGRLLEALNALVEHWGLASNGRRSPVQAARDMSETGPTTEWQVGRFGDAVPVEKRGTDQKHPIAGVT